MSEDSSVNGNDRKKIRADSLSQDSDIRMSVQEADSSYIGRGRGRAGSNSDSSSSGQRTRASGGEGSAKSILEEDRQDGRAQLLRFQDPYCTRPSTFASSSTPLETGRIFSANYFQISRSRDFRFTQYRVDFQPEEDQKNVRRFLIGSCRSELRGYVYDGGNMIFTTRPLRLDTLKLKQTDAKTGKDYILTFSKTGEISMTDGRALHVLNCILRKAMLGLNLKEMNRNLFDPEAKIDMKEFDLTIWPGYSTSIRQHETEILVNCEIMHKVMRKERALDVLWNLMKNNRDFQTEAKKEMIGAIVLTPYNNKTYRVDDILFDKSPRDSFERNGQKVSYANYYKERYNITIQDVQQPLLVSNPKARDVRSGQAGPCVLIPELCIMTGFTRQMRENFFMMKAMGEHTRLNPQNRAQRLLEYSRRINQTKASNDVLESFGLEMSRELRTFGGRVINQEKILFGRDRVHQNDDTADWTNAIRSNTMYRSIRLERWGYIYTARMENDVLEFMKIFKEVARGQEYQFAEPKIIKLRDDRIGTYSQEIESFCAKDPKFVLIFVPNNASDRYATIKKITYAHRAVPSQVVVQRTIQPKKQNWGPVKTIATKILLQINCKLGGAPWMIGMPMKGVMVIGFDVSHDTNDKSKSFGAFVASMDLRSSVKYYSTAAPHRTGEEIAANMNTHMQKALITFKKEHGCLPERILFYRDGVSDGQIEYVHKNEVTKIQDVIKTYYKDTQPKFAFIVVSKRINTRIFEKKRGCYENPVSGTVIDREITLPYRYEFFLISQSVRQGTVSPTNYNVIYDEFGLSPERLQQMTYKMCHLYYNWSGTTRVPAVVQYAHKLSILLGQFMHQLPNDSQELSERLYYL